MQRNLAALDGPTYDVAIVGGGIVGACVARDAALRGFSTALVERRDFCSGTSAASSHMIHGGIRYLRQMQLGVVRESLRERRTWQAIAPHLVHPLPFILPLYGRTQTAAGRAALALFDALAWDRGRLSDPDQRLPARTWWTAAETRARLPAVTSDGLAGAICYFDCGMSSPERLCLEVLEDAERHGAVLVNYVSCDSIAVQGDAVTGLRVRDEASGAVFDVRARCVVNATGPWTGAFLATALARPAPRRIVRSKGVHIIVRQLHPTHAITILQRHRHALVVPFRGHSLIGTTDTVFEGDTDDVQASVDDVRSLLDVANSGLSGAHLTPADVVHTYAGLRPLLAAAATSSYRLSRRAEVVRHDAVGGPRGLISALGGKWTTARHVAELCVDAVAHVLGERDRCSSHTRPLPGAQFDQLRAFRENVLRDQGPTVGSDWLTHLLDTYGSRYSAVLAIDGGAGAQASLGDRIVERGAEVRFAIREEQALHLTDVVLRRTGLGALGTPTTAVLDAVTRIMTEELQWTPDVARRERAHVDEWFAKSMASVA
ncbi:MAG: glycerol-3-phosphate dehydrogenase/oxidase [Gemmatimonadaceae bacterium]